MAIIAGIDEAGYGPLLGPLVVSSVALEIPDELLDADLWQVLSSSVCRSPDRKGQQIAIGDSKALYSGQHRGVGLLHLERAVLAALWCLGKTPASIAELLDTLAPGCTAAMQAYPWYRDAGPALPRDLEPDDVTTAATLLLHDLERHGLRLRQVRSEVVLAGQLNDLVEETGNKAQALFAVNARHLRRLRELAADGRSLVIHLDHHGARKHYRDLLQDCFSTAEDTCWVWIREEAEQRSSYTVETGSGVIELAFTVDCEQQQLPVALASMLSKYLRELLIGMLNHFWQGLLPDLEPTAGYTVDGRRFLKQIEPELTRLGIDRILLVRNR